MPVLVIIDVLPMFFVGDFHIHSKYSRATAKDMDLESLNYWAQLKGVKVLGTGDFTHPKWFRELKEKLEPAESGLYRLKPALAKIQEQKVPENCRTEMRFLATVEISSIYSKNGRVRKVHTIIFAPSLEVADKINHALGKRGNLSSDGRPILGLDAKELAKIVFDIDETCMVVPAHAWTPHFSVFGSNSGFDSLEECFEELTPKIFAIETGLSSDPAMNWRLSKLDAIALISNSDCHSPSKIAREANIFDTDLSYDGIRDALRTRDPKRFLSTIEFFPEEGKYHYDGHRNCQVRMSPAETKKAKGLCPKCGTSVTVGVMHRVEKLADRPEGTKPPHAIPFKNLIPLEEIIADSLGMGVKTGGVEREYMKLIGALGNELRILLQSPREELERATTPLIAEGMLRVRDRKAYIEPGYDGEYGKIRVFTEEERETLQKESAPQASLF